MSISPFVYRPAPGWDAGPVAKPAGQEARTQTEDPPGMEAGFSGQPLDGGHTEEEILAREKQAWERGVREGESRGRAAAEAAIAQQRDAVAAAIREFVRDRETYFHNVEGEVVALCLAIVRKILRREAQVDPLLLAGLVRVALEKMAVRQNVRLRVHPSQVADWREYFAQQKDLPQAPELQGDAALEPNQCELETELGVADLNLETQLKEIEQGLFDLLAQRPAPR
ncbi:MAG: FliH/SctL family protein [Candidatus Acidiferrales bacterium]